MFVSKVPSPLFMALLLNALGSAGQASSESLSSGHGTGHPHIYVLKYGVSSFLIYLKLQLFVLHV